MAERCACPSQDPVRCFRLRHGLDQHPETDFDYDASAEEECWCGCHNTCGECGEELDYCDCDAVEVADG